MNPYICVFPRQREVLNGSLRRLILRSSVHPIGQHIVEFARHFLESLALFFEQAPCYRMVRACRGNVGLVMNNNEQITDIVIIIQIGSQAGIAPSGGCWGCRSPLVDSRGVGIATRG